jgi:hypothetical protein
LEQPFGVGRAPATEALLGERCPVLDGVRLGDPRGHCAQVALRVDHRADVPHRLAGGAAVPQVREDFEEGMGQAADERQRQNDEHPLAPAAGPHDMGQADQLKTEDQGGERRHGDNAFENWPARGNLSNPPLASVKGEHRAP